MSKKKSEIRQMRVLLRAFSLLFLAISVVVAIGNASAIDPMSGRVIFLMLAAASFFYELTHEILNDQD